MILPKNALKMYGLKRCSTCVKALAWLQAHNLPHDFIDYRATPPTPAQLRDWQAQLGGWEKLVNRASTTWRTLPDADKTPADDAAWLALIAQYPTLIKRPVLLKDDTVTVGYSEKQYAQLFSKV